MIDKFPYIGSTETGNPYILFTRKGAGFDNLDKARRASALGVGAHSVGHSVYVTARMFAYMLDLKQPKFVVGFTDPEMDVVMQNNELDARTTSNTDSLLRKDMMDNTHVHATISNPKGWTDPRLPGLPDLDTFAKNDKERNVIELFRAFHLKIFCLECVMRISSQVRSFMKFLALSSDYRIVSANTAFLQSGNNAGFARVTGTSEESADARAFQTSTVPPRLG